MVSAVAKLSVVLFFVGISFADSLSELETIQVELLSNSMDYQEAEVLLNDIITNNPNSDVEMQAEEKLIIMRAKKMIEGDIGDSISKFKLKHANREGFVSSIYRIAKSIRPKTKRVELYRLIYNDYKESKVFGYAEWQVEKYDFENNKDISSLRSKSDYLVSKHSSRPDLPKVLFSAAQRLRVEGLRQDSEHVFNSILELSHDSDYSEQAKMFSQANKIVLALQDQDNPLISVDVDEFMMKYNKSPEFEIAVADIAKQMRNRCVEKSVELYRYIQDNYSQTPQANIASWQVDKYDFENNKDISSLRSKSDYLVSKHSLRPDLPKVLFSAAQRLRVKGLRQDSEHVFDSILELSPDSDYSEQAKMFSHVNKIVLALSDKDKAALSDDIAEFTAKFSESAQYYIALSDLAKHIKAKDEKKSIELYEYILNNYPNSLQANNARWQIDKFNAIKLSKSREKIEVKSLIDNIIERYSDHSELPKLLYEIGNRFRVAKKGDEASFVFDYILVNHADTDAAKEVNWVLNRESLLLLNEESSRQEIDDQLETFISSYTHKTKAMPVAIYKLAEKFYNKGNQYKQEDQLDKASICYENAVMISLKVLDRASKHKVAPEAYYIAALCYRELGEIDKSIQYFDIVVNQYSEFELAWYAQFMIAQSYEKMIDSDKVQSGDVSQTKEELVSETLKAYSKLLEQYPSAPAAKIAKKWLKKHQLK